jgi:uncharacterized protein (DUF1810 family)
MIREDLDRFVEAQEPIFESAMSELRGGRKRTHWMWFVFPQLRGLGRSPMAERYGIADLAEARSYLAHPLLRARLLEATEAMLANAGTDARAVLGEPDDAKLRSCLTLFIAAAEREEDRSLFKKALDAFFEGKGDPRTLAMLRGS